MLRSSAHLASPRTHFWISVKWIFDESHVTANPLKTFTIALESSINSLYFHWLLLSILVPFRQKHEAKMKIYFHKKNYLKKLAMKSKAIKRIFAISFLLLYLWLKTLKLFLFDLFISSFFLSWKIIVSASFTSLSHWDKESEQFKVPLLNWGLIVITFKCTTLIQDQLPPIQLVLWRRKKCWETKNILKDFTKLKWSFLLVFLQL